jgi:hypothetical protein
LRSNKKGYVLRISGFASCGVVVVAAGAASELRITEDDESQSLWQARVSGGVVTTAGIAPVLNQSRPTGVTFLAILWRLLSDSSNKTWIGVVDAVGRLLDHAYGISASSIQERAALMLLYWVCVSSGSGVVTEMLRSRPLRQEEDSDAPPPLLLDR